MKKLLMLLIFGATSVWGQQEPIDWSVAQKIKQEERLHSDIETLSYRLLDYAGPRLAGSEGMERAYGIALDMMKGYGLSNARIETARPWPRGGWNLEKAYVAMTVPYYLPIFPAPVAWTNGTPGPVKGEVTLITARTREELQALSGQLKGKIVLMPSTVDYAINYASFASRHTEETLKQTADYPLSRQQSPGRRVDPFIPGTDIRYGEMLAFIHKEEPAVILHESGDYSVPGVRYHRRDEAGPVPCEVNIACENHRLMENLITHGEKVVMDIDVQVSFSGGQTINNVIAEIPGTDPKLKDELVIIGAHWDSYQLSPGAGDDGAGCMAMLEAMRILKAIDAKPRRTIRLVFWGGEEMGLHGSSGYVEQYVMDPATGQKKKEYDKISAYFNSDYGPGKFRGIYTQDNLQVHPLFTAWAEPFADMGFTTVSNRSVGSTDHIPFDNVGIPGFQFIQDPMEWGRHSHRTQDFSDRLVLDDIRHNAVIAAWFAYNAAMRDAKLPRK